MHAFHRWRAAAAAFAIAFAATTQAAYPDRPITLIVPFPPGGGTDLSARLIVPYIEKYMGGDAKIVVINKGGAGGDIGAAEIAKSKADCYTIGFMNVPNTLMKSHERPTSWNLGSFVPIANLVYDPAVFAVRPDGKYQTLAALAAEAKKRPGQVPISSAGAGSNTHLDLIAFEEAAGVTFLHVPYEGGGQSRTALLGGHVEAVASALGDVQRFIEQGQLKALAIGSKTRSPLAPGIPTFIEQGFKVEGGSSRGLVAPKGTPQECIDLLAQATEKALKDPELVKKANEIALPLDYMSPAAYGAYLTASDKELAALWKRNPWVK
ncbi:MAG: tripartite tricarboxylate transporter substrate binding protein [Burkholderiales bacterium]